MGITNVNFRTHGFSSVAAELHHNGKLVRFQYYMFSFQSLHIDANSIKRTHLWDCLDHSTLSRPDLILLSLEDIWCYSREGK